MATSISERNLSNLKIMISIFGIQFLNVQLAYPGIRIPQAYKPAKALKSAFFRFGKDINRAI
jgi:hypothetical protein